MYSFHLFDFNKINLIEADINHIFAV